MFSQVSTPILHMLPIHLLWRLLLGFYCLPHDYLISFCLQGIMTTMRVMGYHLAVSMQMSTQPT